MTPMPEPDPYEEVPYPSAPVRCTRPESLAVVGALAGIRSAPPDRCRVLEIGCGDGGNLLPMALGLPGSAFVGIDPSGPAIDLARGWAQEVGVANATFEAKGVEELDGRGEGFDYIITHGVFSWVAPNLQQNILEASRRLLKPGGLAYVSYNTFPGWHARGMVREMMLYHVRNEPSPQRQIDRAREFLVRLADAVGATEKGGRSATDLAAFGALLVHEREMLASYPDAYFYHEHLQRTNLPLYFHEFMERAARQGLQYVSEALWSSSRPGAYPAAVGGIADGLARDPLEVQQYLDFATNRAFRQSVLCRAEETVDRNADPARIRGFLASSPASAVSTETFAVPWGWTLTTSDPALRSALTRLGKKWPEPIAVAALGGAEAGLLEAFGRGMVEIQAGTARFTTSLEGPLRASRLARIQASRGRVVTNLRHEQMLLDDVDRAWIPFLDGTRGEAEMLPELTALVESGRMAVSVPDGETLRSQLTEALRLFLTRMAGCSLLEAAPPKAT
jgi:SAM-dependent methyltransferase